MKLKCTYVIFFFSFFIRTHFSAFDQINERMYVNRVEESIITIVWEVINSLTVNKMTKEVPTENEKKKKKSEHEGRRVFNLIRRFIILNKKVINERKNWLI